MTDFKIRSGLSTDLFINGNSKSGIIDDVVLENGCWYLCADTAELFICVQQADGLTLKCINEKTDLGTDSDGTSIDAATIIALRAEINRIKESLDLYAKTDDIPSLEGYATEQYVLDAIDNHEALTEVKTKLDEEVLPVIPTIQSTVIPTVEKVEAEVIPTIQELAEKAATKEWVQEQNFVTETFVTEKISDIEIPKDYITEAELEAKGYLTEHQSLEGYATEEFVVNAINAIEIPEVDLGGYATEAWVNEQGFIKDISGKADKEHKHSYNDLTDMPVIPSVEGLASEQYVDAAIANIEHPSVDLSGYALKSEVAKKANEVLFTSSKLVTKAMGSFSVGDDVRGLTIAEIIAKLLGLEAGAEPEGIIEEIIAYEIPMYSISDSGMLFEVPFKLVDGTAAPVESGFYTITDNQGNIVEAGYQDLSAENDEMYYMIALPKEIDYNTMVEVESWDPDENLWSAAGLALTSDHDEVARLCDEAGVDISHIDTTKYTVWAQEDVCTGSIIRYRIVEEL